MEESKKTKKTKKTIIDDAGSIKRVQTSVISRFKVEGVHRWKACPIEEVSYLREYHRHVFHIEVKAFVTHSDRDIEFIQFAHKIERYLNNKYFDKKYGCLFFDDMSCEMIANELVAGYPIYEATVSEDGEGGSTVTLI